MLVGLGIQGQLEYRRHVFYAAIIKMVVTYKERIFVVNLFVVLNL